MHSAACSQRRPRDQSAWGLARGCFSSDAGQSSPQRKNKKHTRVSGTTSPYPVRQRSRGVVPVAPARCVTSGRPTGRGGGEEGEEEEGEVRKARRGGARRCGRAPWDLGRPALPCVAVPPDRCRRGTRTWLQPGGAAGPPGNDARRPVLPGQPLRAGGRSLAAVRPLDGAGVLAGYRPCPHPRCPDAAAPRRSRACALLAGKPDGLEAGSIGPLLTKAALVVGGLTSGSLKQRARSSRGPQGVRTI